jgi:hypothetical protein
MGVAELPSGVHTSSRLARVRVWVSITSGRVELEAGFAAVRCVMEGGGGCARALPGGAGCGCLLPCSVRLYW